MIEYADLSEREIKAIKRWVKRHFQDSFLTLDNLTYATQETADFFDVFEDDEYTINDELFKLV